MERNKIIEELWLSKEVNQAFSKMQPEDLRDDLKSEVFMVLLEMPEDKLIGMYKRNELRFFLVRVMLNMIKSDRSGFYKLYRNFVELDVKEKVDNQIDYDIFDRLEDSLADMYWYQSEIIKLYTFNFNKNAKELSKDTGIPYMSIIRTLKQTKNELRKKIRK